eukprot:3821991-Prorocentrum_lima.AAC.1
MNNGFVEAQRLHKDILEALLAAEPVRLPTLPRPEERDRLIRMVVKADIDADVEAAKAKAEEARRAKEESDQELLEKMQSSNKILHRLGMADVAYEYESGKGKKQTRKR